MVALAVQVSDRTGNTRHALLDARVNPAPGQFSVSQNVPNPFNPRTAIPFAVSSEIRVSVEVYDILGRRIAVLADEVFAPGTHRVIWESRDASGRPVSSGIYFYRVSAGDMVVTKKMVLMR